MTYALDTNAISDWLKNDKNIAKRLNHAIEKGDSIVIPTVVYYELRRGFKYAAAPGKEHAFSLMCQAYSIEEMNIPAWEEAANIYAKARADGKTIEDADILIAAFCIVNSYTLVTNNVKHFKDIDGLKFENWV